MRATVLVIEEDPDLAKLFESILHVEGYEVLISDHFDTARRAMATNTPDVVVCDWSTPDPTGYLWLDAVRGSSGGGRIPVLFVCDELPNRRVRDMLGDLGVPTIEKPFDLHYFCQALAGLLPLRERAVGTPG
jgi:DNA-binding response OmpR family regulator